MSTTMKQEPPPDADDDAAVDAIVRRGPTGAFAVAGVATAIVVAIYFAFYFLVYLPRGVVQ
jgi:hypothetical protein